MSDKQLPASVASVLHLMASEGLDGKAEIRCRIKDRECKAKATIRIGTHSAGGGYGSWIKHLEIEFDDDYIDDIVRDKVARIFATLAAQACNKESEE